MMLICYVIFVVFWTPSDALHRLPRLVADPKIEAQLRKCESPRLGQYYTKRASAQMAKPRRGEEAVVLVLSVTDVFVPRPDAPMADVTPSADAKQHWLDHHRP